jgi:hypothetical protein
MRSTVRPTCLALAALLVAAAADAATIRVSTTAELKAALATAHTDPGRIIEMRPGRYPFSGYSLFNLGPFGAGRPIRGLTIRGLGASPRDVVLAGTGMDPRPDAYTGYGFVVIDALDVTFENFEIRDVRLHLFALKGERGYADRTTFRKLRLVNAGQQFIKGTANRWVDGADDGLVEDCHFEYEFRPYVARRVHTATWAVSRVVSPTEVIAKLRYTGGTPPPYGSGYWTGASLYPKGKKWTRRVVGSAPVPAGAQYVRLTVAKAVPNRRWPDTVVTALDLPDAVIPDAWGPNGGYTEAIDVHTGSGWVVRRSTFVRIGTNLRSDYAHAVQAILFWSGSHDTTIEDVSFYDCESGVMLGLGVNVNPAGWNHNRGVVRRAWFYRNAGVRGDRAFGFENSRDATIEEAHVVVNGTTDSAVEYRFPGTTGFVASTIEADVRPVEPRASPGPATLTGLTHVSDPERIRRFVLDTLDGW